MKMYEDNRDPHLNRFKNIVRTLEKVINISESKGYDTLDLEADLETLNAMIKKFQDDYGVFIQKLKDTRNYTCGHSEGQFKQSLKLAKDQLKVVRQDIENIKKFIKETIKDDIKQLRQQKREEVQNRIRERLNKTGEDIKQLKEKIEERLNKTGEKAEQLRERMNERLNMGNKIRNR